MNVPARRAIEALRSGVPSGDAVRTLGCDHTDIVGRFESLLSEAGDPAGTGAAARGLLVSGGYGAGKSHLLTYLMHSALSRGFVVSPVTVSKETLLGDPGKVFATAVAELRVPGRAGSGLRNLTDSLNRGSSPFRSFFYWTDPSNSGLPAQFAATLYVFDHGRDPEFNDQIVRFWAGGKLSVVQLRNRLRELGQSATYALPPLPRVYELALHRFRFISQLVKGAGYKGWLHLLDEVEPVGSFTLKQRAKAYGELARWLGYPGDGEGIGGIGAVAAIMDDFVGAILVDKNDREMVPLRLEASLRPDDVVLSARAVAGMDVMERHAIPLDPPTPEKVRQTRDRLLQLYREAYQLEPGWSPRGPANCRASRGPV